MVVGGKVVLDTPRDRPEGVEVRVEFVGDDFGVVIREEHWPIDSAVIAADSDLAAVPDLAAENWAV